MRFVNVSTFAERVRNRARYHWLYHDPQWYSATVRTQDEAAAAAAKEAAANYNSKRAMYRKQVSSLRKEYASEVALQRTADETERAARQKETKRRKLESQRLKNMRSAQNAKRQLELREQRRLEWEEELKITQVNREARNKRFQKARQLLIDELEQEAPLWLTTPAEIDAAFASEASQKLWVFPNSVVGAPAPTDDAQFWQYESHTWHMDKTYQTQREHLLEELIERSYEEANIDRTYWSPERLEERKKLEEKAKLRAMVIDAGKRSLLLKQKQLLQDLQGGDSNLPRVMPVPNVQVLANREAMEKEGAAVLLNNPTNFFDFDSAVTGEVPDADEGADEQEGYQGPTLGAPIGLKDPIRTAKTFYRPFPDPLGKIQKDTRSQKEKKREQREQAMRAPAEGELNLDLDLDDFDQNDVSGIDYNNLKYESDEEWAEGLDPVADKDILNLPKRDRYSEEDVDWVIQSLEQRVKDLEQEINFEVETARQELRGREASNSALMQENTDGSASNEDPKYIYQAPGKTYDLAALGVDEKEVHSVLTSLTEEQMLSLHAIDHGNFSGEPVPSDQLRAKLAEIPGLSQNQIDKIVALEEDFARSDLLRRNGPDDASHPK